MAGIIRLFEKDLKGLLHEVPPGDAEARRQAGTVSRVSLVIDVLLTDVELEQRAREEAAAFTPAQGREPARR
jgi:hypothetical protein